MPHTTPSGGFLALCRLVEKFAQAMATGPVPCSRVEWGVPGTPYTSPGSETGRLPDTSCIPVSVLRSDSKESAGIAADSHPAGSPEATGVEPLWPRENGQLASGGEWGATD